MPHPFKFARFETIHLFFGWVMCIACLPALAESRLTTPGTLFLSSENNGGSNGFKISVHPGIVGYYGVYDGDGMPPGEISTDPFNNPIRAYRFWNIQQNKVINTYAQSGKIIGDMQATGTSIRLDNEMISESAMQLWESTHCNGMYFSTPADYISKTMINNIAHASGSIDISQMAGGSIYFIYGAFRSTPKFTVVMGGSNTAVEIDLGDIHNGDYANNNEYYLAQIDFVNKDGYQSVDWAMPEGANYRFAGIIVTAPSTQALTETP